MKRMEMIEQSEHLMSFVDQKFVYRVVSKGYENFFGLSLQQMVGHPVWDIHGVEGFENNIRPHLVASLSGKIVKTRSWIYSPLSGKRYLDITHTPFVDKTGSIKGVIVSAHDITDLLEKQQHLIEMSVRDYLTKCYNRRYLVEQISQLFSRISREKNFGLLFFMDVNNFKGLNDKFGHKIGDSVLKETAKRLIKITRPNDILARVGGDEFVLLIATNNKTQVESHIMASHIVGKIKSCFCDAICIDGHFVSASLSVGYTLIDDSDSSVEMVLNRADLEMYKDKL